MDGITHFVFKRIFDKKNFKQLDNTTYSWTRFKKIIKNPITCVCCKNKLMHGIGIGDIRKDSIMCNKKHNGIRGKGDLIWLSKLEVILSGITVKFFERFVDSDTSTNDYHVSYSSSRITLPALKSFFMT